MWNITTTHFDEVEKSPTAQDFRGVVYCPKCDIPGQNINHFLLVFIREELFLLAAYLWPISLAHAEQPPYPVSGNGQYFRWPSLLRASSGADLFFGREREGFSCRSLNAKYTTIEAGWIMTASYCEEQGRGSK